MASKMMDQGGMMEQGAMMGMDKQEIMTHLKSHISYPATKRTIVESCNNMEHVPASTRTWVEKQLPEGTYKSSDEVLMKLGL